jgi:DNA-binding CsgD family transcriptional regulator
MATPHTADMVRARLSSLAAAGLNVNAFCQGVTDLIRRAVPFEYACLATTDPATGLITSTVKSDSGDSHDEEYAHYEYEVDDLNQCAEIARRSTPVGVLDFDTDGRPDRSVRFREFLRPTFSFDHELRAAFRSGTAVWGSIAMCRTVGSRGFSPAEADFMAGIAATVATGIRAGLVSQAGTCPVDARGPAVLVVGTDNQIAQVTPAADTRVAQLSGREPGGGSIGELPMPVLSIIAAARAFAAGRTGVVPKIRVRTTSGQWLVLHAAPLQGSDEWRGEVVVTLEEARVPEVMPLLAAGFRLTAREQDIVELVLRGADTNQIAKTLGISENTVQDHLKPVFKKVGVSTRQQLSARIFFEHYAPQLGTPLSIDGWFRPR